MLVGSSRQMEHCSRAASSCSDAEHKIIGQGSPPWSADTLTQRDRGFRHATSRERHPRRMHSQPPSASGIGIGPTKASRTYPGSLLEAPALGIGQSRLLLGGESFELLPSPATTGTKLKLRPGQRSLSPGDQDHIFVRGDRSLRGTALRHSSGRALFGIHSEGTWTANVDAMQGAERPCTSGTQISVGCQYHLCTSHVVEIRYSGTTNVYKTKSFRCQNSDTRLYLTSAAAMTRAIASG
jgi:hypothetical protein